MVLDGKGSDLYDTDKVVATEREVMGRPVGLNGDLPFFNPPFVALLFAPLATLSVATFSIALTSLVIASVLAGGLCLQALVRPSDRRARLILWLAYLTFIATFWMALTTQLSMLLFLGWFGFAWFQVHERPQLSGASLVLTLVKPQSVVLVLPVLIWKRQWQTLAYFSAIAIPLVAVSLLVAGSSALIEYPSFLLDSTRWEGLGVNTASMFGWNRLLYALTGDLSPAAGLQLIFSIPTVGLAAVAFRGAWVPGQPRFYLQVACLLLATLLINPHLYLQDLALLSLALGFYAAYERGATGVLGASTILLTGAIWLIVRVNWYNLPSVPLATIAMGALLSAFVYLATRSTAIEAALDVALTDHECSALRTQQRAA
jgi:hypothetical protein